MVPFETMSKEAKDMCLGPLVNVWLLGSISNSPEFEKKFDTSSRVDPA